MTLATEDQTAAQTPPTPTPEPPKKKKRVRKQDQANEIAKKYTDLEYAAAKQRIMEETPCSKSVAHKAYHHATRAKKQSEAPQQQKPTLSLIESEDKTPAFLEPPTAEPAEVTLDTAPATPEATQPLTPEQQEQLDLFRDMMRGFYNLAFSNDGILGKKYGRTEKQCEQLADMQYRWLMRRYTVEDMQKWDSIMLLAAYGTFFGGIAKDYIAERRKATEGKRAP